MDEKHRKLILALAVLFAANMLAITLAARVHADLYKRGASGATVSEIQTRLKSWGYYDGAVDGVYGSRTEAAVRYFRLARQQRLLQMRLEELKMNDTLLAIAREKASIAIVTLAELRSIEVQQQNAVNLLEVTRQDELKARTELASLLRMKQIPADSPLQSDIHQRRLRCLPNPTARPISTSWQN